MTLLHAAVLGLVEGLTEFLPISSTFHLLFVDRLLGVPQTNFSKFFDVFIQAGAILPVVLLFGREWLRDMTFLKKVAVSFVPTAVVGFLLHSVIKNVFFESSSLMLAAFVGVGVLFLVVEWLIRKEKIALRRSNADVTYLQALMIGCAQACAVLPGVSRAGAVMVMMMTMGVRRDEAAKYSFSLAVPTIMAAAVLDTIKIRHDAVAINGNEAALFLGFAMAFVSSLMIIRWFIRYLHGHTLNIFGVYRFLVGGFLLLMAR